MIIWEIDMLIPNYSNNTHDFFEDDDGYTYAYRKKVGAFDFYLDEPDYAFLTHSEH